jgi:hypothetical protein
MQNIPNSPINLGEYEIILPKLCGRGTSVDPEGWSENNPLHGHCAVVSLQAQKLFEGTLLRASLENTRYAHMRSHYKNRLIDGDKDFTSAQFTEGYPEGIIFEHKDRSYVLSMKFPKTIDRYVELTFKLHNFLKKGKNSLFADSLYKTCISNAVLSPCQKAGFGAVLVREGEIVSQAYNDTIPELASQCTPKCIRLDMQSRTESMIGACGHAEEWVMKYARDKGVNLRECEMYIAGLTFYGLPWIKTSAVHTCLRCAVQMNYAGLKGVYVPVADHWERLSTNESLKTAERYALKIDST